MSGIVSEIIRAHHDRIEEEYELAQQNFIVCSDCGEVVSWDKTMSDTAGTHCFNCLSSGAA